MIGAIRRIAVLSLLAGSPVCTALAQGIDLSQGGPVDVSANDGIEWRQAEQVVIARGGARAVRGGVTVNADRLLARYRQAVAAPGGGAGQGGRGQGGGARSATAEPAAQRPGSSPAEAALGGSSEIWRLEAEGNVAIATATDTARGQRAVYDIDQAVLVLSGGNLSLATPQQVITARDSLEYWSSRRMAVARGNALVVDPQEGRRIAADTLVAYFLEGPGPGASPPRPATPAGDREPPGAGPGAGKVDRVEAFGNVEIRTPTDVVRGERGVYSPATGLARLLGGVRITRGENQLNGQEAIVNMRTGVARLVSTPGARVQGLILPNQQDPGAAQPVPGGSGSTSPAPERRGR